MRLIDADAFRHRMYHEVFEKDSEDKRWDSGCWMRYRLFDRVLEEQPTVEQHEIIHCRDCVWHNENVCRNDDCLCRDDDFCSWAERREVKE